MEAVFGMIFHLATKFTIDACIATGDPQFAPKESKLNKDLLEFDWDQRKVKEINKLLECGTHDDDLQDYEGIINTIFGSKSKLLTKDFHDIFESNKNTHWFTKAPEIRTRFNKLIDDEERAKV